MLMRSLMWGFALLLFLTGPVLAADPPEASAKLEKPKVGPVKVATDGKGELLLQLNESQTEIAYELQVEGLVDVYMAHIHLAGEDVMGPMVAWLYPVGEAQPMKREGMANGVIAKGVIRAENLVGPLAGQPLTALVKIIEDGQAYVNVHTGKYVTGELRGQVKMHK